VTDRDDLRERLDALEDAIGDAGGLSIETLWGEEEPDGDPDMVVRNELVRRKTGRTVVYWRAFDEGRRERPTDTARSDPDEESGEDADSIDGRSRPESDGDLADAVRTYLEANDIPPKTDHGRGAVIDVFRYLREHGTTKTGAIQDAVYPEYEDSWSTPRTMWNAVDRHLEAVPGIEKGGYGKWTYTGDESVRETVRGDA